jgi:hypothetical protein
VSVILSSCSYSFNKLKLSWQQITCFMTQPVVETQNHRITLDIVVWSLFHYPVCWHVLKLRFNVTFPWNTILTKTTLLYFTSDWMEFCSGDTCSILLYEFHFDLHWISEMTTLVKKMNCQFSQHWFIIWYRKLVPDMNYRTHEDLQFYLNSFLYNV